MADKYAVKVDLAVEGLNRTAYVGNQTRLNDPASYASSAASARLWKRRGSAEKFISQNISILPQGARVVTISVADD